MMEWKAYPPITANACAELTSQIANLKMTTQPPSFSSSSPAGFCHPEPKSPDHVRPDADLSNSPRKMSNTEGNKYCNVATSE